MYSINEIVAQKQRFTDIELKIARLSEIVEHLTKRIDNLTRQITTTNKAAKPADRAQSALERQSRDRGADE